MALFGRSRGAKAGRKAFSQLDLATRAITFYAEDGGSWPHFEPIVRELTDRQGRDVVYLTSGADDPVLDTTNPRLHAFEIGDGVSRTYFFRTLEAGVVVATVPQLGIALLPRSQNAATLGMHYVYVFHSMVSTHMIYEPDGFDHYDTVLCAGPYMADEIRAREKLHSLSPKLLVEHGYGRLDTLLNSIAERGAPERGPRPVVLIAPSWGPTCILETVGAQLIEPLLAAGFEVIARPHPMTTKKSPAAITAIAQRFGASPHFHFDEDIVGYETLARADVMISDWSGAALEFAFAYERPVVFVDVARKVNNASYRELGIEPFEATVRDQIGAVIAPDALPAIAATVRAVIDDPTAFATRIRAVRDAAVFNVGTSAAAAAAAICERADAFLAKTARGR